MSATDYYGLSYMPFSGDADNDLNRFDSNDLKQAIAVTQVTSRESGIGLLTGPAGSGITFSAYYARQNLDASQYTIRYYPVCHITPRDFYKGICRITGTEPKEKGREAMISAIRERALALKAQGRPFFLFVDNAQNIPNVIMQDIPTLMMGEYGVLCGTEELRGRIRSSCGDTLHQLVCGHYSFHGLSQQECSDYVIKCLTDAGASEDVISKDVLDALRSTSYNGNFRTLRNLMRNVLRFGAQEKRKVIDMEVLRSAASHLVF